MTDKLCPVCQVSKPTTEFHKDRSKKDGFNLYCKPCTIARQRTFAKRPPRNPAPEGFKRCSRCKETKPETEFFKATTYHDGIDRTCKVCRTAGHESWRLRNLGKAAAHGRKWRAANPDRSRDHGRKANYGLPMGAYAEMLTKQNGVCAICKSPKAGGRGESFHVDHCHDTERVRGLLCTTCNLGIGQLKHDPKIIRAAALYLELSAKGGSEGGSALSSGEKCDIGN